MNDDETDGSGGETPADVTANRPASPVPLPPPTVPYPPTYPGYPPPPYMYPPPPMGPHSRPGQRGLNLAARLLAIAAFVASAIVLWFGKYTYSMSYSSGPMTSYSVSSRTGDRLMFVVLSALGALMVGLSFINRWIVMGGVAIGVLGVGMFLTYTEPSTGPDPYWAQHLSVALHSIAVLCGLLSLKR